MLCSWSPELNWFTIQQRRLELICCFDLRATNFPASLNTSRTFKYRTFDSCATTCSCMMVRDSNLVVVVAKFPAFKSVQIWSSLNVLNLLDLLPDLNRVDLVRIGRSNWQLTVFRIALRCVWQDWSKLKFVAGINCCFDWLCWNWPTETLFHRWSVETRIFTEMELSIQEHSLELMRASIQQGISLCCRWVIQNKSIVQELVKFAWLSCMMMLKLDKIDLKWCPRHRSSQHDFQKWAKTIIESSKQDDQRISNRHEHCTVKTQFLLLPTRYVPNHPCSSCPATQSIHSESAAPLFGGVPGES